VRPCRFYQRKGFAPEPDKLKQLRRYGETEMYAGRFVKSASGWASAWMEIAELLRLEDGTQFAEGSKAAWPSTSSRTCARKIG